MGGQIHRFYSTLEEDAAKAYDNMVRIKSGNFGRYNFPLPTERSALTTGEPARRGAGA